MKKLLIIQQPVGNRGDESAHRGLINRLLAEYDDLQIEVLFFCRLRRDIDEFVVNSPRVSYKSVWAEWPRRVSLPIIKWLAQRRAWSTLRMIPSIREFIRHYDKCDYIMCAPGGINLGGFQDWFHLMLLTLASQTDKPLIYFGRSIGPFKENDSLSANFKEQSEELLKKFAYLSLRDETSQRIADDIGVKYYPTIDSAFLSNHLDAGMPDEFVREIGSGKYIVFVPNSLVWHFRYKEYGFDIFYQFWVKLANRLIEEYPEHRVVMLPQTTGWCEAVPDGFVYFNQIKNGSKNPSQIYVLDEKYGSDPQQAIIKGAELLVGARYHSIIFAINQGTPFVALSYEHKMNGVISMLGKEECQVDLDKIITEKRSFDGEDIETIINKTRACKSDLEAYERASEVALSAFDKLKEIIK